MTKLQRHVGLLIHMAAKCRLLLSGAKLMLMLFLFLGLISVRGQEAVMTGNDRRHGNQNNVEQPPIRLVLQTSKLTYRTNEEGTITAYLENVSDRPYYVGNELLGFYIISSFHYIELTITDEKNKEVTDWRASATSMWGPGTTVAEKIAREYVKLRPGMVHGVKSRGRMTFKPGRYRLTATYREKEAMSWTEAERNALPIPVWTQTLVSNTVMITVLPQSSIPQRHRRTQRRH